METKTKGNITEAYVIAKFLERGFVILKPYGDNERYDLVIDRGNGFERVQIKTLRFYRGKLHASTIRSSSLHQVPQGKNYTLDEVDLFAFYSDYTKNVYLVEAKDRVSTGKRLKKGITFSITPSKNKQQKGILYAADFLVP